VQKIDITKKIRILSEKWQPIEQEVFNRLCQLFETPSDDTEYTAYLSQNERCSYNALEGYFFINMLAMYRT